MALNNQDSLTELTFHYVNGQTESFNIVHLADGFYDCAGSPQKIMRILEKPLVFCICSSKQFVSIPPIFCVSEASAPQLQGEGVFSDVRRVTAPLAAPRGKGKQKKLALKASSLR